MDFNDKKILKKYLRQNTNELGFGSQGITYYDYLTNKIVKVYHQFFDKSMYDHEFTKEEILKFGNYTNDTYIFPDDTLSVNDTIYGYHARFVKGHTLDTINPLTINIDNFINAVSSANMDVKEISKKHISSYDVLYNTMYDNNEIHVIDTDEYSLSSKNEEDILNSNIFNFNMTIMYFLIDTYFDEIINSNACLKDMYKIKICDILEFLKLFKQQISEHIGNELITMDQAIPCINKTKRKAKLIRIF